jgi:hypothetical protein
MAAQSQWCAQVYAQVVIIACGLLMTCPGQAIEGRPPLSAACQAWNGHIAELIDQHRIARELDDDQLGDVIRRFYEAQYSCSARRFEEGLTLYDTIPIGSVASRLLR